MKIVCATWFILGFGLAAAGVVTSFQQMVALGGGFLIFPESHCGQNQFYIGTFDGSGIKNPNDAGAFSSSKAPGSFYDTFYKQTCVGPEANINCGQYAACCSWDNDLGAISCDNSTALYL